MLRLASPDGVRLASSRTLDATFGGGEANVAVSLARLGVDAAFVTALPDNDLGEAARRSSPVTASTSPGSSTRPGRLGIYFLEPGAAQRPSRVLYDRSESSFMQAGPGDFPWESLLAGAAWFHTTGITPALSASAAQAALAGARAARAAGATVSVDLNYRAKLWNWGKSAGDVMAELVAEADVLIGNEEDADKVFGIHAPGSCGRRWHRRRRRLRVRGDAVGGALPATPHDRVHAARIDLGVGEHLVGRARGHATTSASAVPIGSRRSSTGSEPATRSRRDSSTRSSTGARRTPPSSSPSRRAV